MLRFILSSDPKELGDEVLSRVKNSDNALFLTPSQNSFYFEKLFFKENKGIKVYHFDNISRDILFFYQRAIRKYLDNSGRAFLTHLAYFIVRDNLKALNKGKTKNIKALLLDTVSRLKGYNVLPETLLELSHKSQGILADKLSDLALIYSTYLSITKDNYSDNYSILGDAINALNENNSSFFEGKEVFISGFIGFDEKQLALIGNILKGAHNVYISLLYDDEEIFTTPKETMNKIYRLANTLGVKKGTPIVVNDSEPFYKEIFTSEKITSQKVSANLSFNSYKTPYDEVTAIAASIKKLITQGVNYRDIAVYTRNYSDYDVIVREVFEAFNIPYFKSSSYPIKDTILAKFILLFFEILYTNYSAQAILDLLKLNVLPFSTDDVALFAQYIYIWDIKNIDFNATYTANPFGDGRSISKEEKEQYLATINNFKEELYKVFKNCEQAFDSGNLKLIIGELYSVLERYKVIKEISEIDSASEVIAILNASIAGFSTLFEQFYSCIEDNYLKKDQFRDLLEFAIENTALELIPQTLDQVIFITTADVNQITFDYSFVLGLNEDEIFMPFASNDIFGMAEKEFLHQENCDFYMSAKMFDMQEMLYAYNTLRLSLKHTFLSAHEYDMAGKQAQVSSIADRILQLAELKNHSLSKVDYIVNKKTAITFFSKTDDDTIKDAIRQNLAEDADFLEVVNYKKNTDFSINSENVKKIYQNSISLSASRLEEYSKCQFMFLLKNSLKLFVPKKMVFDPLSFGNVIHYIMEKALKEVGIEALFTYSREDLENLVTALLEEYIKTQLDNLKGYDERFLYLYNRSKVTAIEALTQTVNQFKNSDFRPTSFEQNCFVSVELPKEYEALKGYKIELYGKIDRIDSCDIDGENYIRIIDYKTGKKQLEYGKIHTGEDFQLQLYMMFLDSGEEKSKMAGVLYLPLNLSTMSAKKQDDIEQLRKKSFKAEGLVLDNMKVISAMEKGIGGEYIPVSTLKSGKLSSRSSTIKESELNELLKFTKNQVIKKAISIAGGICHKLPREKTCITCPFKAVCLRDEKDDIDKTQSMQKGDFFEKISEELKNND